MTDPATEKHPIALYQEVYDSLDGEVRYRITDYGREGILLARIEGDDYWVFRVAEHHYGHAAPHLRWARYLIDADKALEVHIKELGMHVQVTDGLDIRSLPLVLPPSMRIRASSYDVPKGETDD